MPNDIIRIDPSLELPAHLQNKEIKGLEVVKEVIRPPVLKIVQKQSRDEILDRFGKGTLITQPALAEVAPNDVAFHFTPIFIWQEFQTWVKREQVQGDIPHVLESTTDSKSALAAKCQNRDLWFETVNREGINLDVRHIETLCFLVVLHNHPFGGPETPMIMTFSKGEYRTGSNLSSLIQMRKASPFDCIFEAKVCKEPRGNDAGTWYGLDITNPSEDSGVSPWCTEEQGKAFEEMHDKFKEAHDRQLLIRTEDSDETVKEPERDDM